jgi:hypothetical protein
MLYWRIPTTKRRNKKTQNADGTVIVILVFGWTSVESVMVAWDKSKHGHLAGNELPSSSTRQKFLCRKIALIISGGPLGKGKNILLPNCARDGIRDLLSGGEGNNMGHMEN